jgi:hypothetical protein
MIMSYHFLPHSSIRVFRVAHLTEIAQDNIDFMKALLENQELGFSKQLSGRLKRRFREGKEGILLLQTINWSILTG